MPLYDEVGYWSEIKLEIVKEYANAYSTIFSGQRRIPFQHVYIDAFAGAGEHISRRTGQFIPGSPFNALSVKSPFVEYYFIDIKEEKIQALEERVRGREDVHVYCGDCNEILLTRVFPKVRFEDYRRGLCFLDPYGLDLDWKVIEAAGKAGTLDVFLNFPLMDINRNVLWTNPEAVSAEQKIRLNRLWGEDWRKSVYVQTPTLFGNEEEKVRNEVVAEAFRRRLKTVAGFKFVPKPIAMRNSRGAVLFYLFFASQKEVAEKIARDIFNKYRKRT